MIPSGKNLYFEVILLPLIRIMLDILAFEVQEPTLYGGFHVMSLLLCFLAGIVGVIRFPHPQESNVRRVLLISSLVVIGLEVYKQIVMTFSFSASGLTADYPWYIFPFQFCSTPMYVGLAAALVRSEKIHKCLCAYLATFSLFAGLAVMFYPSTVFVETLGINIQTMVCHGVMVSLGIYLLFTGYVRPELKTLLHAIPVFMTLITAAMVMNEVAHRTGLLKTDTFNMFFISPYCAPSLPVYSLVQTVVPFPLSIAIYILGFALAAGIVLGLAALIKSILHHKQPV